MKIHCIYTSTNPGLMQVFPCSYYVYATMSCPENCWVENTCSATRSTTNVYS